MTATATIDVLDQFFETEINRKLADAAVLANTADKDGRGMSPDEQAKADGFLNDVADLQKRRDERKANEAFRDRINEMSGPTEVTHEDAKDTSSIGAAFVKSLAFKATAENFRKGTLTGNWSSGAIELPWGAKTNVTEALSPIVPVDVQPGIVPLPTWPLRVADLFAQGTTSGITVRFIQELAETNAAAGTAEAASKPESAITFQNADATVGKIATFLPVSDEMLEDVDQMESFLNNRLGGFVLRKEDSELLNGAGAPSVTGILQTSGIQTATALSLDTDSVIDAIFYAITAVRVTGLYEPDAIVVNPTDWAAIRLMKDTAKQYYGGGPFTGAYGGNGGIAGDSLWGLPVVVTTSIAVGTVLIGAFKTAAQIFRRRGLTVEMSNSHGTFFKENMTAIRAETREALVVYRPLAFYSLTGANLLEGS